MKLEYILASSAFLIVAQKFPCNSACGAPILLRADEVGPQDTLRCIEVRERIRRRATVVSGESNDDLVLIITGSCLRAEEQDRPLAYSLREEIEKNLPDDSPWACRVVSDIWYLNSEELHSRPAVSIGGPGVNGVAQYWLARLPNALAVDNVFVIQMDVKLDDTRCSIWGMDHETTVEALDTFVQKGYLERFLAGIHESL